MTEFPAPSIEFLLTKVRTWIVILSLRAAWAKKERPVVSTRCSDRALLDLFGCSPWRHGVSVCASYGAVVPLCRCGYGGHFFLSFNKFTNGWGFRFKSFDEPRGPMLTVLSDLSAWHEVLLFVTELSSPNAHPAGCKVVAEKLFAIQSLC